MPRTFRRDQARTGLLDLGAGLAARREALDRFAGPGIALVVRAPAGGARVRLGLAELETIVKRMIGAVRHTMPLGGRVDLTVQDADLEPVSARLHGLPRPGAFVEMAVADTGGGVSPATRSDLFAGGELAAVARIVQAHDGTLTISSEPGLGSVVRVYLPRTNETFDPRIALVTAAALPRGRETILLLEHDPTVRAIAGDVLADYGYTVRAALDAHDAVRVAQGPRRVHLLVADLVQPGVALYGLVRQLREFQPDLRVLFMTTRADHARARRRVPEDAAILERPFTVAALVRRVREALDR